MSEHTRQEAVAAATRRKNSAESDERHLTFQIEYHDVEATRLRKQRQNARARKGRAEKALSRLATQAR